MKISYSDYYRAKRALTEYAKFYQEAGCVFDGIPQMVEPSIEYETEAIHAKRQDSATTETPSLNLADN